LKNCPLLNRSHSNPRLAVKLAVGVLSHEARDTIRILKSHSRIAESEWRAATSLWVVLGLELVESDALVEIIGERDIGWQVGAGVQSAGALAAVELGDEGVLVDPVGAGGWVGQAGGDAVAGAVDAVFGVEIDFGDDAGHVDALVIADAAGFVVGDHEVGELACVDLVFADSALVSLGRVLEDVGAVIHVMLIHIMIVALRCLAASDDRTGESGGSEKDSRKERSCEAHIEDVAGLDGR
jgi:hypothetical protein